MRSSILSRLGPKAGNDDAGVYAVLYAVLVVVLVGIAAIVVDIAGLRQDRRDNRAAADSAAVAGAEFLNPIKGGIQPKKACDRAWLYLNKTLSELPVPTTPCSEFTSVTPNTYCSAAYPGMITAQRTVGDRTVIIAWPVPQDNPATAGVDESHKFLNPDVAPDHTGGVTQVFASDRDGSVGGCDRLGVAVIDHRSFGLASGIGIKGQATSIHSVARFDTKGGFQEQIAALNVLNLSDCRTLSTTGGGKVLVGPTVDNLGNVVGPGIIAVDSTGTTGCTGSPNADGTGGGDRVIDPANATGNLICAASVPIPATGPTAGTCDGLGKIQSYAYYNGNLSRAFNPARVPTNLRPSPTERSYQERWFPVTALFGCTSALNPCVPPDAPEPNYIQSLVTALGGTGAPTSNYPSSQAPYVDPAPGGFTNTNVTYPQICAGSVSGTVSVPAGNWYVPCSISVANGGAVIFQGGTLVVEGTITTASGTGRGGCFVMNVAVTTCPDPGTFVDPGTKNATTSPAPTRDAIVYLRGNGCGSCSFDHAGSLAMPQTFMYAAPNAGAVRVNSTNDYDAVSRPGGKFTLWTAPIAGAVDPITKRGTLEDQCLVSGVVDAKCLRSRFSKLVYWSSYAAPSSPASLSDSFNGQGSISIVGVFFTPTAYFNLTGGGNYVASFAQFWSDKLDVSGGAFLGLSPDIKTAISTPSGAINLIR